MGARSKKRWYRRMKSPAVYLTYDDGPNPAVTPYLLELLHEYAATATFFLSGESMCTAASESLAAQIVDQGHAVGNHGLKHSLDASPQFAEMHAILHRVTGVSTKLIRSPFGLRKLLVSYMSDCPEALAFHWSGHFHDWQPMDFERAEKQVCSSVRQGSILLMHDGYPQCDRFQDRSQVLRLTRMILEYCRTHQIRTANLAWDFPELHQGPATEP